MANFTDNADFDNAELIDDGHYPFLRYSKWEEYGNKYAVFNFSFLSEDHSDIINNTHLREQKQAELYGKSLNNLKSKNQDSNLNIPRW